MRATFATATILLISWCIFHTASGWNIGLDDGRLEDEESKPEDEEPKPEDEEPKPEDEGPKPEDKEPKPEDEGPKPEDKEPKPEDEEPKPEDEKPKPVGLLDFFFRKKPKDGGPKPEDEEPKPEDEEPKPEDKEPKPEDEKPKPEDKEPKPEDEKPKPVNEGYKAGPEGMLWTQDICPQLNATHHDSLEGCKEECSRRDGCTAFNYAPTKPSRCELRSCPLPVPEPTQEFKGWRGYSLNTDN